MMLPFKLIDFPVWDLASFWPAWDASVTTGQVNDVIPTVILISCPGKPIIY